MSQIDYDWLIERLRERGVDPQCPRCRHKRWIGLGENHDQVIRLPAYDLNGEPMGTTTDFFGLVCLHCGFLDLHGLAALLGDASSWPRRGEL